MPNEKTTAITSKVAATKTPSATLLQLETLKDMRYDLEERDPIMFARTIGSLTREIRSLERSIHDELIEKLSADFAPCAKAILERVNSVAIPDAITSFCIGRREDGTAAIDRIETVYGKKRKGSTGGPRGNGDSRGIRKPTYEGVSYSSWASMADILELTNGGGISWRGEGTHPPNAATWIKTHKPEMYASIT